ncbi:DNA-binding protein [Pseudomonas sp. LS1212]|uniref:DNA-binding protein n=1 Tax=Pseudomonas sp. LS1212 TaxID=2972478 RepID=UPI00215BBC4A|nr:DNA-binding protein [Pseudomonas sp. LS1212]UVJ41783.1 DNA-binding protein [Pseudomonas sp. LS1212]
MARGGVNKAVVQKARQALLARGENPSIDAIRVELGNTGSKTTIHRYLKELDDSDLRSGAVQQALGDELGALVGQLAARLKDEAQAPIEQAQALHDAQKQELEAQLAASEQALKALQQAFNIQKAALEAESAELSLSRSTLQAEQTRNARLSQASEDLQVRLKEKDEQIGSLEDKHLHARDALEHYRSAVKEQREQEQRRHEGQLQQVQVEVRQLQQTLIVKQDELTRLNRDNERVLVEARLAHKLHLELENRFQAQTNELGELKRLLDQSLGARDELKQQAQALQQELATLGLANVQQAKRIELLETRKARIRKGEKAAT